MQRLLIPAIVVGGLGLVLSQPPEQDKESAAKERAERYAVQYQLAATAENMKNVNKDIAAIHDNAIEQQRLVSDSIREATTRIAVIDTQLEASKKVRLSENRRVQQTTFDAPSLPKAPPKAKQTRVKLKVDKKDLKHNRVYQSPHTKVVVQQKALETRQQAVQRTKNTLDKKFGQMCHTGGVCKSSQTRYVDNKRDYNKALNDLKLENAKLFKDAGKIKRLEYTRDNKKKWMNRGLATWNENKCGLLCGEREYKVNKAPRHSSLAKPTLEGLI